MTIDKHEARSPGEVTTFSIALPPALKAALFKRAQTDDRSAGSVARKALAAYLDTSPQKTSPLNG